MRLDIPDSQFDIGFMRDIGETKGGISLNRDIIGVEETIKVLSKVGTFVNIQCVRTISAVIADLLASAQPRVPWDTGQLRESGRGTVKFGRYWKDIAYGNKDGTVRIDPSRVEWRKLKGITEISGNVFYFRLSDDRSVDVSVFTHEYLNPYGSGLPYSARKEGTGPKYLETAWEESKNDYFNFLLNHLSKEGFNNSISKILQKRSLKRGEYTLDYNDIILSKVNWMWESI